MLSFASSLYVLHTNPWQACDLHVFSLNCSLSFHPLNGVFCKADIFGFDEVQFIRFFCLWFVLSVLSLTCWVLD